MDNLVFFAVGLAATVAVVLLIKRSTPRKPDLSNVGVGRDKRSTRARTTTKNGKKLRR
jgi:hypothetical protein